VNVEAALSAREAALEVARTMRYEKGAKQTSAAQLGVPLPAGIDKQLTGPELTLRQTYGDLTSNGFMLDQVSSRKGPLEIRLDQGSDARTEYNATIKMTLKNRSKRNLLVYFRREFVTFHVVGPSGVVDCNPGPDRRAPDRQAFVTLTPGASRTYVSRLDELCPSETFEMPGLYLVNARYDATESGAEWNLAAFTGTIASQRSANVRIRTGDSPILHKFTRPSREALNATSSPVP
jgi:hypothetical protein